MFRSKKTGFEEQKDALTIHNGIIFRGVVPFIPPKPKTFGFGKSAWDTSWEGISQNDSMVAWNYPRRSTFFL